MCNTSHNIRQIAFSQAYNVLYCSIHGEAVGLHLQFRVQNVSLAKLLVCSSFQIPLRPTAQNCYPILANVEDSRAAQRRISCQRFIQVDSIFDLRNNRLFFFFFNMRKYHLDICNSSIPDYSLPSCREVFAPRLVIKFSLSICDKYAI